MNVYCIYNWFDIIFLFPEAKCFILRLAMFDVDKLRSQTCTLYIYCNIYSIYLWLRCTHQEGDRAYSEIRF